ncbi:cation-efflux pump [Paracidobacterium acidisoli]|uniref:Cation-efflux pump n=1 Tax=Paracidobacterium acidisoli TaxID=2303751 RepID=A0A372IL28_9BACT|nr:cation-efflux pump [Paracidobacterium acidisoli]MBT9332853.1 cation-efflux pump [Paracidobacterium acidisoli]
MQNASATISPAASAEKRSAALVSVAAACVMTALKLFTGLLTGSLGMLSDGAHSALDLVGAALTLLSVRVSDRPADENHPYGHAKVENVSAFVETFLMAASAVWISGEAVDRIFFHSVAIRYSVWPLLVLMLSITVDYWRSRHLRAVANRYKSEALEADAMHFASDIWSSVAVFVGLLASWTGSLLHIGWLRYTDSVAAIAVSLMILVFSWRLAWRTVRALTDYIPAEVRHQVLDAVRHTDGVLAIDQARVRRSGSSYFADLTLSLSRQLTFQRTEELVRDATEAVQRVLPGADVVIHTVPRSTIAESIFDKVRAVASRNNVVMHDVSIQSFDDGLHVEQHIEVPENMPLRSAHDFVRSIEEEIRTELPQVSSVLTHIESEPATIENRVKVEHDRRIERHLRAAAVHFPEIIDIHDIVIGRVGDHIQVSCHCTLPDEMEMQRVHEVITLLEDRFKQECPEVNRMLIHPEPATDNHHR